MVALLNIFSTSLLLACGASAASPGRQPFRSRQVAPPPFNTSAVSEACAANCDPIQQIFYKTCGRSTDPKCVCTDAGAHNYVNCLNCEVKNGAAFTAAKSTFDEFRSYCRDNGASVIVSQDVQQQNGALAQSAAVIGAIGVVASVGALLL
ncbi:hypothetical protein HGRIS_003554 [Hohenbuehelia grisea]|uniref:Extracellular membrane protein CFEM domain-containing protein n=1 Tax=Hohenbuehelia grisea TaxID=104357 RepID=A0ABR3JG56_9AGAR